MTTDGVTSDVLVVGAGPTGLMLADWLLRLGVSVTVVDGKSGPTRESRAMVLQARTMEIYDQLGIVDTVLDAAERAEALAPGFESRAFGRIPLGALGRGTTAYPWIYVLEQSRNEEILYAHLRELGGEVRWQHRLTALAADPAGVEATITGPDGETTVRARFCVGADGSSSAVRQARGIAFEGVTNAHTFYVVDATTVAGLIAGAVNMRPGRQDFLLTFPMAGRDNWRLIGVVRDENADDQVTEDDVRSRLRRVFAVTYGPARWFATYRVHHRVAAAFRDGPVFLAGDAAHVHSPVGAQGMNTGLQDAHNLAFKLADVVQGRAGDGWLDRYEAERRPVAKRLISTTDRVFGAITSERPVARLVRRLSVPLIGPVAVGAVPRASGASRLFQYVSQTRIHYWMSADAQRAADGRRDAVVGRRLPWADGNHAALRSLRWQVHAYGGVDAATAQKLADQLGLPVHAYPPAPATPLREGHLYLVRPDGFVAADATPHDAPEVFRTARP
jgi:2-polyprenyl-6-methoxyphenol hydroxylase-like FAD-dependent oxidoreductase